ncbi:MAG: vWA domain-containing protein [Cellvibrionaceae bacterium]
MKSIRPTPIASILSSCVLIRLASRSYLVMGSTRRSLLSAAIVVVLTSACSHESYVDDSSINEVESTSSEFDEQELFVDRAASSLGGQASANQLPSSAHQGVSQDDLEKQRLASQHQMKRMVMEQKAESAKLMKQSASQPYRAMIHAPVSTSVSAPVSTHVSTTTSTPALLAEDRETYLPQTDNPVHKVSRVPVSTFSIDVDTASYSNVRRMIQREGRLPQTDAVKAEEFINYFDYHYPQPESQQQPFSVHTELMTSPWNENTKLLKIGLQGYQPEIRPAANLVFLVDVSGSMQSEHKLGLAKRSLKMLAQQMQKEDRLALVVYAGAAGVVLASTSGDQKQKIFSAIDQLTAGGSTHGSAGIELAYQVAREAFIKDGINRVLIASDGDMNVGTVDHNALKDLVVRHRDSGIALSTLGFGSGNYNYALMEQLADVGNGNAAYVDSLKEAHRVLVQQMNSTLMTIAKDVKIQVEFNPRFVAEYRLIGYENRMLRQEDFRNDKVDAGEIGAGHDVTALYELSLVGSDARLLPELRYANSELETASPTKPSRVDEFGFVKLRYKHPNGNHSRLITMPLASRLLIDNSPGSTDMNFSAAVAGFAQLLRGGAYLGSWGYDELLNLARNNRGSDHYGHRAEFVNLIELSRQWQLARHARIDNK